MKAFFSAFKVRPLAHTVILIGLSSFLYGCPASSDNEQNQSTQTGTTADTKTETAATSNEGGNGEGKGVGPISHVELAALDNELAQKGKGIFDSKCASCHKLDTKYVGPALQDVTKRRKPEWIMNMILNPEQMLKEDPDAKALFAQFMLQMPNQNMDEASARAILEYFRSVDGQ